MKALLLICALFAPFLVFPRYNIVLPKKSNKCLFDMPKMTHTYEFVPATGENCKKGDYKLPEEVNSTVNDP